MYWIMFHCFVLFCVVLYDGVVCGVVLFCVALFRDVVNCAELYCMIVFYLALYNV